MAKTKRVRVIIPSGYGLNCEEETAFGYRTIGAEASIVHINDIIKNPQMIDEYHILALVGGFADGDHIASGKIHANRLRYRLGDPIRRFIGDGKLVVGVCNGFQTLVKSGILPGLDNEWNIGHMTVTYNNSGIFEDRWVNLRVAKESKCVWTKGIKELYLPVRHGEGKVMFANDGAMKRLEANGQVALLYTDPEGRVANESDYPNNPNGSVNGIAGICDPTGRVFGMMPHWEAFMHPYNHPNWVRMKHEGKLPKEGLGMQIPRNAVGYVERELLGRE